MVLLLCAILNPMQASLAPFHAVLSAPLLVDCFDTAARLLGAAFLPRYPPGPAAAVLPPASKAAVPGEPPSLADILMAELFSGAPHVRWDIVAEVADLSLFVMFARPHTERAADAPVLAVHAGPLLLGAGPVAESACAGKWVTWLSGMLLSGSASLSGSCGGSAMSLPLAAT